MKNKDVVFEKSLELVMAIGEDMGPAGIIIGAFLTVCVLNWTRLGVVALAHQLFY